MSGILKCRIIERYGAVALNAEPDVAQRSIRRIRCNCTVNRAGYGVEQVAAKELHPDIAKERPCAAGWVIGSKAVDGAQHTVERRHKAARRLIESGDVLFNGHRRGAA